MEKHKRKIVLNQPIENETNDWIGVSKYVDKLEEAIDCNANMIAITSDFGAGKSSLISLLLKRYSERYRIKNLFRNKFFWNKIEIHIINLWSNIDTNSVIANEGKDDFAKDRKFSSIELHKSFLFNLINQISVSKGSYLSKRLSKSYGLIKIQSNSRKNTILASIAALLIILSRRGGQIGAILRKYIPIVNNSTAELVIYAVGVCMAIYVLCKADILFSTAKSEGKREIDENILIDYYNQQILFRGFWRKHYVFVLEDIDRTDDLKVVVSFLKEMRKYYLPATMSKKKLGICRANNITFVVNIKPEALLNHDEAEKLYPKFFDYIIELKKINIDNYDVILLGLLNELKAELEELQLISPGDEITIEAIPGMQWMIRGSNLDIREIKERLNKAITLYSSLKFKFKSNAITFEKCAVATYITNEYSNEYYKLGDKDFEELIESYIGGTLEEDIQEWGGIWKDLSPAFKSDLQRLIQRKLIDSTYRTYFYNYPKGSKLYNLSETVVFNAITYNEKPAKKEEFEKHLNDVSDIIIEDALKKVVQLGLALPEITLKYERIFLKAVDGFLIETIGLIGDLKYDESNIKETCEVIRQIICYDKEGRVYNNKVADLLASMWNDNIEKNSLRIIRKMICEVTPDKILWYSCIFSGKNELILPGEIDAIGDVQSVLEILNYEMISDCVESCKHIHKKIIESKYDDPKAINFYGKVIDAFGIDEVFEMVEGYCVAISRLDSVINEKLLLEVEAKRLSKKEYIKLLEKISNLESKVAKSLVRIKWYSGMSIRLCMLLYNEGFVLNYICNVSENNIENVDLFDEEIREVLLEKKNFIFDVNQKAWMQIRNKVIKDDLIEDYIYLFAEDFPIISENELMQIDDIYKAIQVLSLNTVTEAEIGYIARYFNRNYHNGKETYAILEYVTTLKTELLEGLFYSLDMDNVRYRKMSRVNKAKIFLKVRTLVDEDSLPGEKIKYMQHVKEMIPELEKGIGAEISNDNTLKEEYVKLVKSVDRITAQTAKNLNDLHTIYAFNDSILHEMFTKKYYEYYVVSKTLYHAKFEIEEEKRNVLWPIYVAIFLGNIYIKTVECMKQNKDFIDELLKKEVYVDSGTKIMGFAFVRQTIGLLSEVFENNSEQEAIDYLSVIGGFASYEAADFFVNKILEHPNILSSEPVYNNTHDKLINGGLKGRYTKARNKLLK